MATDNKYDRQLRLWGPDGQKRLSEASILLINASAAGTEALKNMILPGVGFITILDDKLIEQRDLGNNFFMTKDDIGKSRAEVTKTLLLELNEDVKGSHIHEPSSKYISNKDEEFFRQFSLVIACDITDGQFLDLTEVSEKLNISLIVLRNYGMIGYLRTFKREHTVIQSKPADKELDDLRLAAPFEELEKYCLDFDLEGLNNMEHSHTPFVIILIKALHTWKEKHDGKLPKTFAEKDEFKAGIKLMANDYGKQINFGEAVDNAYKAFAYEPVPHHIQEVLDNEKVDSKEFHSNFWCLVSALKEFVANHGCLPVSGKVPDMTATSEFYITLQKLYQKKAKEDRDEITKILSKQAEEKGLMDVVCDDDEIKTFCESCSIIEVTKMRSFKDEIEEPDTEDICNEFFDEDSSVQWYIAVRAVEIFRTKNNRYPGDTTENISADVEELKTTAHELVTKLGADESFNYNDDYLFEMARYSDSTLHNICAFLGGVAAQECVKLITEQYTPLNHTFIFDGAHSKSQVFNP